MSTIQAIIPDNISNDNDMDKEKTQTSWNRSVYRLNTLDDNKNDIQKLEQYSTIQNNNNINNNIMNKYTIERPHDRIDYRSEGGPLIEYLWTTPPSTTSTSTMTTTPPSKLEQQQQQQQHVDQLDTSTTTGEIACRSSILEGKEKELMIIKEDNIDEHIDDQLAPNDREKKTTKNGKKKKQPKSDDTNNNYNNNDVLKGQTLYLGSEISNDGQYIYHIPGHAERILVVHIPTNTCTLIGPILKGKYKWLRGICINNYIYGLPCRADTVLRINTITQEVSFLSIPYDKYYSSPHYYKTNNTNNTIAHQERTCQWKYHGGSICPIDGNIYCIPQSALHVLQINPITNICQFVGIPLYGKYKWYGGVIGKQDGAIYGIPHNSISVLRILPSITTTNNNNNTSDEPVVHVTLHGHITETTISPLVQQPNQDQYNDEHQDSVVTTARDHKWHGAAAASDGTIVCVPANADTVLCIYPKSYNEEPELVLLGVTELVVKQQYIIQSPGRHRTDRKYKYLGATCNPSNGNVYCFPCAAERVLEINPCQRIVREIGPNLYDTYMERICQNKYQNGIYLPYPYNKIIGIPLAAETVLCIDFNTSSNSCSSSNGATNDTSDEIATTTTTNPSLLDEPVVTTWPLPQPYKLLGKCEGALATPITNIVYCVPNCHKAVIRIEFSSSSSSLSSLEEQECTEAVKEEFAVHEESNCNQQQEEGTINEISNSLDRKVTIDNKSNNINNSNVDAVADAAATIQDDVTNDTQHKDTKTVTQGTKSKNVKEKSMSTNNDMNYNYRPDYKDCEHLTYKSGIPTLRSSSHRVKYNLKSRIHNPQPKDTFGNITNTLSLPTSVCTDDVFSYNEQLYQQLNNAIIQLLQTCNKDLVGSFRPFYNNQDDAAESVRVAENGTSPDTQSVNGGSSSNNIHGNDTERLEDFIVPVPSTWRSVNGGSCESAQKYLSDAVATDTNFLSIFDQIVQTQAIPYMHRRIQSALSKDNNNGNNGNNEVEEIKRIYYYQRPPTIRLQPGPAWTQVKPHNDAEYGHQNGELNFWLPLTDRTITGVDLYCETQYQANDYHPVIALPGQIIAFHGSSCRHYVNTNSTNNTRVSIDFRIGVQGYFDPLWQMKGTSDDHGRMEYEY